MPINPSPHCAVIVAKPGAMRDAWRALLTALPRIRDIEQVEDAVTALKAIARLRPALVVADANVLKGETDTLLRQIQALSPETQCVAFTETVEQKSALEKTVAGTVMLHGAPAAEVAAAIERLLTERGAHACAS